MRLQEPQQIILDFLELISTNPITYYELEKITKRHYSTTRSYVNFLDLLGFVNVKKFETGSYIKYEITISEEGQKVKDRVRDKLND
jgi:hypothetical protein